MRINKFFLLALFYIISLPNTVNSHDNIAFIDLDYIVENSKVGKIALKNISDFDKKNISILNKKNKELKSIENEIKKKQNLVSKDIIDQEIASLKIKIKEFSNEKNKMVSQLNEIKNKELKNALDQITPIIKDYMDNNSIKILLNTKNIFMGDEKFDITNIIIEKLNNVKN